MPSNPNYASFIVWMGEKNIQIRPWIFLVIINGIFNCGTIEKKENILLKVKFKKIVNRIYFKLWYVALYIKLGKNSIDKMLKWILVCKLGIKYNVWTWSITALILKKKHGGLYLLGMYFCWNNVTIKTFLQIHFQNYF